MINQLLVLLRNADRRGASWTNNDQQREGFFFAELRTRPSIGIAGGKRVNGRPNGISFLPSSTLESVQLTTYSILEEHVAQWDVSLR